MDIPKDMFDAIGLDSGLYSQIGHLMDLFGRAEVIAKEYKARRPDRPVMRLLKYAIPSDDMQKVIPELYDAHVRELIERAIAFVDEEEAKAGHKVYVPRGKMRRVMEDGTAAEALLVLMKTSEVVPLHGEPGGLYIRLFKQCFPNKVSDPKLADVFSVGDRYSGHESFKGAWDQLEGEIRRKCARNRDQEYKCDGSDRVKKWDDTAGVSQQELLCLAS